VLSEDCRYGSSLFWRRNMGTRQMCGSHKEKDEREGGRLEIGRLDSSLNFRGIFKKLYTSSEAHNIQFESLNPPYSTFFNYVFMQTPALE
jgi:hypothetical protein